MGFNCVYWINVDIGLNVHKVYILCTLLFTFILTRCNSSVPWGREFVCSQVLGLTERQRVLCRTNPNAMTAISLGIRLGYDECKTQMSGHRWNCSGVGDGDIFGHVMVIASKEAAFIYAITSAGVTYALADACYRGTITACGCQNNLKRHHSDMSGFKWRGCSADIEYSMRVSRKFLDSREIDGDERSLMNLHNNRVGRKMVKLSLNDECKCHGVSGSCSMKTCWKTLPPFHSIGQQLKAKYINASPVAATKKKDLYKRVADQSYHLVIKRSNISSNAIKKRLPKKLDLVYLDLSPNYCYKNLTVGSHGTRGRVCSRTSRGEDGCESLCCGRGYNTNERIITKNNCKFIWCCKVECEHNNQMRIEYTCN